MAKNEFEWFHEPQKSGTERAEEKVEATVRDKILSFFHDNRGVIFLTSFIFVLSLVSSNLSQKEKLKHTSPSQPPLEVFMSMWPIKKGETLPIQYLKVVPLNPTSLTKTQKFQILEANTQFNPETILVAKKDIPPNKPIFWRSLELKKLEETASEEAPRRIQYAR